MVSSCIGLALKAQTPMAAFLEQKMPVLTDQPLWIGDTTRTILRLVIVRDKPCIIPYLSKGCLPTARSRGSIRTSIGTQPSLPSLSYSDPTRHFHQRGFYQCVHELWWRGVNDPSWILHDRWNNCHPQHHDWWYHVLHIYEGFELWIFLDSVFPHTIDFTNALEIQSIFGFELSVRVKWLDNPRWFFLSTSCNQIVVTNGTMSHVLSMPTGYYTFSKFIEAVG